MKRPRSPHSFLRGVLTACLCAGALALAAAPAQAAPAAGPTLEERLKKLKSLKDAGLLEDAEYQAKRAEILKDL